MGIGEDALVDDAGALASRVNDLGKKYRESILVEEFCEGPEFTVGIRGTGATAEVIAVMEIVPRHGARARFIYSLDVKRHYQTEVEYHVPPRRPAETIREVSELALGAYRELECRDIGRVDIRLDAEERPNFIEINPLPGLNPESGDIVILSNRAGLSYSDLVNGIVVSARTRWKI